VSVALSATNPPHTHWTTSFPTYGIADRRFVITVAPQNDICLQGSTHKLLMKNLKKSVSHLGNLFVGDRIMD
jgi:hypothetical protein